VLLLVPLVRRRDARPISTVAAGSHFAMLLAAPAAAFSNYNRVAAPTVADTPAAMADRLAHRLAENPDDLDGWLMLGRSQRARAVSALHSRHQRADRLANGATPRPSSVWLRRW
jgi:cytochrome c-type biogenesis protein CcmH/NrfG